MFKSVFTAAALAAGLGFAAAPATAAPLVQPTVLADAAPGVVENVHFRRGQPHAHNHRGGHHPRRLQRRYHRHYTRPRTSFGVQLNFGPRYGYAPRYRSVPVYRGYSSRHHAWCEGRYRSYSRSSGTYQPYHGPRRRCNSPYDGI